MLKFYRTGPGKFMAINLCFVLVVCVLILAHLFWIVHFERPTVVNTRDGQPTGEVVISKSTGESLGEEETEHENNSHAAHNVGYDINFMPYMFRKNATPGFIFGTGRRQPVTVVVGIPHVKRPSGHSYLNKTLDSLTQRIFPADEDQTAIVVFIAEKDDDKYVRQQASYLYKRYKREFDSGLLQVIGPPTDFYPDFQKISPNLGDPAMQVWWRSKEIIDAAILMLYGYKMADYYLMIEDDVIAAKGYMREIIDSANSYFSQRTLIVTAASGLGSIGKIFKSSDIPIWVSAFLTFYNLKPIDWLIKDVLRTIGCSGISMDQCFSLLKILYPELANPLFFHIGYLSSLPGRTYKELEAKEKLFGNFGITTEHQNPIAEIQTPIKLKSMEPNLIQWYMDSGGLKKDFCLFAAVADDFIVFNFKELQSVSHILLKTGIFGSDVDSRMCQGCAVLEVSNGTKSEAHYNVCGTSDYNGNLECRFSTLKSLTGFRISIKEEFERQICFSVVYVKTQITMKNDFALQGDVALDLS